MEWLTIVNTVLIAVIGIGVFFARNWILSNFVIYNKKKEADEKLFKELVEVLPPSSESIRFLKEHEMIAPFRNEVRKPFHTFKEIWGNVDHSFHNRRIEKRRKKLYRSLSTLLSTLAEYTFPGKDINSVGWYRVPAEWSYEQPERYEELRKTLDKLASTTYIYYCQLIDFARRKLGC